MRTCQIPMSWLLALLAAVWLATAALVFLASRSAVHEILAAILVVAGMICLAGAGVYDALRDIEKRLPPKDPKG